MAAEIDPSEIVRLEDVYKFYRRGRETIEVLNGLNLSVYSGEFLALMGPSGSGKTTLLNLMAGLDRPTSGRIIVAGEAINNLSNKDLARWRAGHVGFVFQLYNLMPMLTAAQNIEIPLLLTKLSRAQRQQRVRAILDLVGLDNRLKHRPGELSGGEQQRVAIARAIVADPTILVCDEPTGDLDRDTAGEILSLLQALNRSQKKTIIMVTHDSKAAQYATRLLFIDKGRFASDRVTKDRDSVWNDRKPDIAKR
jgi:putative ABC transport system ATP-binding protein